jgi:hypothetical protein
VFVVGGGGVLVTWCLMFVTVCPSRSISDCISNGFKGMEGCVYFCKSFNYCSVSIRSFGLYSNLVISYCWKTILSSNCRRLWVKGLGCGLYSSGLG